MVAVIILLALYLDAWYQYIYPLYCVISIVVTQYRVKVMESS